jgi:hypothetical protein
MLERILDLFPDESFLIMDGFDEAIIGFDQQNMKLIYSVPDCIDILISEGMSEEDAIDHFEYNVRGSANTDTPILMDIPFDI